MLSLRTLSCACLFLLLSTLAGARAFAQAASSTLSGTVSDPSGARIPQAVVHVSNTSTQRQTTTDANGSFTLAVPAGTYDLIITSPGFDPYLQGIRLRAGATLRTDAKLVIATEAATVEVMSDSNSSSTSAADNHSATVFSGEKLDTLSDDDATLQQQIQAIAGGDGQHPPQVFVDGFSGGQFPPKSSIREIRINQNPFSAQYDSLGFGRIEISTKPGTGDIHGQFDIFGNNSSFNSLNPFTQSAQPAYYRYHTVGNISGPIGKKTSFFLNADYNNQQNNAIINAQTVDAGGNPIPFSQAIADPQSTADYSGRLDRQLTTNNTLTARYEFNRVNLTNGGLTQFTLPSEAYNNTVTIQTTQIGDTQVLGAHAELETRFQWLRTRTAQTAVSNAPSILVQGTVSGGGSPLGNLNDSQDQFELQEYGSLDKGKHYIRAGMRYRFQRDANSSTAGFNGIYTFTDINSYANAQKAIAGGATSVSGASLFQLTAGQRAATISTGDISFYAEDEWKMRKNLTLDYGVRFESQSAIPDHSDPSPHVGIAWALGQTDKKPAFVVLRTGAGIFYDRFQIGNLLTAVRQQDATRQQVYTVQNPNFYPQIPPPSSLSGSVPNTTYRVARDFHSEYDINAGATAEFNLGKRGTVSFNYLLNRGVHAWYSRNANAPQANGVRPFGDAAGNMYEFASGGQQWGHFFFSNPQINITKKIQFWGFFIIQHNNSDTQGPTSFTTNSYNVHQDWGRARWDRRLGAFTGVDADVKWGLHVGLFLATRGGTPLNITTGTDLNGDTQYNDRPAFASASTLPANLRVTPYGNFDVAPALGAAVIPINYGGAPSFMSLQMQVQDTIKFGPRKAPKDAPAPEPGKPASKPDPRYAMTLSVEAQNVTNTVSPGTPIGVLNSTFFGKSIATANNFLSTTAANRVISLHMGFRF